MDIGKKGFVNSLKNFNEIFFPFFSLSYKLTDLVQLNLTSVDILKNGHLITTFERRFLFNKNTFDSVNLFTNSNRTVPWPNFKIKILKKLLDRDLKCIYIFYRTDIALSKFNFTFNFCRVVFEKFGFKVRLRYDTNTVRKQVRWNYCNDL